MPAPTEPAENRLLGVAMRCISATCFAAMAGLLKAAGAHGANAGEFVFYRSVGALPVVAVWVMLSGGPTVLATKRPSAHLTRSVIGFVSMVLTLTALSMLPIAQATTLTYSAPIIATILSALLLREAIGARRWAAVVAGFIGVLTITDPWGARIPLVGLCVGLAASIGQAAVMITLRQIGKSESPVAIVFWFTLFTSVLSAPSLLFFGQSHDLVTYALLFGAGLSAGFGQITMTNSLRFAPVAVVVPFDYLQILWAVLIGWFLLGTPPTSAILIGAAIIAGSGIYTAYRESRRGKEPSQALAPPEG